jgi:hypothetical protein
MQADHGPALVATEQEAPVILGGRTLPKTALTGARVGMWGSPPNALHSAQPPMGATGGCAEVCSGLVGSLPPRDQGLGESASLGVVDPWFVQPRLDGLGLGGLTAGAAGCSGLATATDTTSSVHVLLDRVHSRTRSESRPM